MTTGRFAPSPSGPLHLGNLRTAVVAWLAARSAGGRFLLRIEDLDAERSRASFERSQLTDLARVGLDWDEPPIRQSQRKSKTSFASSAPTAGKEPRLPEWKWTAPDATALGSTSAFRRPS